MRMTYDANQDSAYLYLKNTIDPGEAFRTVVCDIEIENGSVGLDFDRRGLLVGLEILGASRLLPPELIDTKG